MAFLVIASAEGRRSTAGATPDEAKRYHEQMAILQKLIADKVAEKERSTSE